MSGERVGVRSSLRECPYPSLTNFFARHGKDSTAEVVYSNGQVTARRTVGELYSFSLKIGKFLVEQGIRKGDPVAIMVSNRPEWLAIYMGIINAGACAVPLDLHLTTPEVKNLIDDARPRFFFVERDTLKGLRDKHMDDMVERYIVLDSTINYLRKSVVFDRLAEIDSEGWQPVEGEMDDAASLIYTSGTTGRPKGVPLQHRNFLSQVEVGRDVNLKRGDSVDDSAAESRLRVFGVLPCGARAWARHSHPQ